jgi:MFS family permease
LCGVWFIVGGFVTVLHFFQVSILKDRGLSIQEAAQLFTVSAITMTVTMPIAGRLFDTVRTRFVIALTLIVNAIALVGITQVTSFGGAIAYAVTFGFTNALMMTMFGYLWPRYFGRAHLGSIQGVGQMFGVVGASLAPVPVGYAIDKLGSASGVLIGLSVVEVAMAAVVVCFLTTPAGVEVPAGLE